MQEREEAREKHRFPRETPRPSRGWGGIFLLSFREGGGVRQSSRTSTIFGGRSGGALRAIKGGEWQWDETKTAKGRTDGKDSFQLERVPGTLMTLIVERSQKQTSGNHSHRAEHSVITVSYVQ